MAACIYCGANDNIVANLTITLDDNSKVTVDICKEHADDATIKTARQKYSERKSEIDDIIEKARALGLELAPQRSQGGILLMQNTQQAAVQRPVVQQRQAEPDDHDMIDTDVIDRRNGRVINSVSGRVGNESIESHQSLNLGAIKEQIGEQVLHGKVKMEVIERQGGGVVAIPTTRVDGLGRTNIRVVQTTDGELQRRFKHQANMSRSDSGWESMRHLGKEGIDVTDCPICRGMGVTKNSGKEIVCPKCNGKGILDR